MLTILLIIAGILLESIVLVGGVYLVLKYLNSIKSSNPPIEVKVSGKTITSEVIHDGVKSALQEMVYEQEQERVVEKKKKGPDLMYSTTPQDEPVKHSGGNLVPYGLREDEKILLEMFFTEDD